MQDVQKSNEVPRKVTLKTYRVPTNLDKQIGVYEDVISAGKSKKHSSKRTMDEGVFIPDQRDVHLDTPASRHKRRRKYVESNVIAKN